METEGGGGGGGGGGAANRDCLSAAMDDREREPWGVD